MNARIFHGALMSLALAAGCGELDPLTALEKATYAEAAESSSDALTSTPAEDGSQTSGQVERVLAVQDCSLAAAETRVRGACDRNQDGTVDQDEQAALEQDFPNAGGGFGPPPEDGAGRPPRAAMGVGGPPPEGAQPPRGARECTGAVSVDELAENPPPAPPRGHRGQGWRKLLFLYDEDTPGTLETEEEAALNSDLTAGCEARNSLLLDRFDVDEDGTLSDAEAQTAQETFTAERTARVSAALAAADADADGSLTCDEQRSMHDLHHAQREADRAAFDADGDGALNDEEKAALRSELRSRVRAGLLPGEPPPPA